MSLYNEVRLVGYCASRPRLITTDNGMKITNLSVYTFDLHNQSVGRESERHRCVFLGDSAERACNMVERGSHITLRGYLRYSKYCAGDAKEIRSAEVLVETFALSPKEKATTMFKRNIRAILREGFIESEDDLGD